MDVRSTAARAVPPAAFNFAAHLLERNAPRAARSPTSTTTARSPTASSPSASRRLAAALRAAGVRREERVLLLMQDSNDWPVAFLGASMRRRAGGGQHAAHRRRLRLHAGAHARAGRARLGRAAAGAEGRAGEERPRSAAGDRLAPPCAPLDAGEVEFEAFLARQRAAAQAGRHRAPTSPRSGSIRRARPAGPRARCTRTPTRTGPPSSTARACSACASRRLLLGRQAVLRLRPGQCADVPAERRRTVLLMAERPTPDAVFKRWTGGIGDRSPRCSSARPTGFAGMLASPGAAARASDVALRLCSSAGEALPAELGERFTRALRRRHHRRHRLDRDAAHLPLQPAGRRALRHHRLAGAGLRRSSCAATTAGRCADGEPGDLYIQGPSAAMMYWGNRDEDARDLPGRLDQERRQVRAQRRRHLHLLAAAATTCSRSAASTCRPFEVEATLVQHPAVLEAAVIGVPDAEGLTKTKAFVVLKPGCQADRGRAEGLRQGPAGAVQVPAPDRVHRRAAEDRDRQDPALQAARAGAR